MFELDNETNKIMKIFKTIEEKKIVADELSELTVKHGLEEKSSVLSHFYPDNEPDFITASCISFGLLNLMEEDFYIVKEVLSYDLVMSYLDKKKKYIKMVKVI